MLHIFIIPLVDSVFILKRFLWWPDSGTVIGGLHTLADGTMLYASGAWIIVSHKVRASSSPCLPEH
jgi:hypothetical protein